MNENQIAKQHVYPMQTIEGVYEWRGELTVPFAKCVGVQVDSHDFHDRWFDTEDEAKYDGVDWLEIVEDVLYDLHEGMTPIRGEREWWLTRVNGITVVNLDENAENTRCASAPAKWENRRRLCRKEGDQS
ncbi:MAG TPA: hypothetical protein PK395_16980 [bacterium]|nr:hypothetical protein [bacterium]HQQ00760.1 hypothetical protein [bacterium]